MMMLGKRGRRPSSLRRTSSLTEFTVDLSTTDVMIHEEEEFTVNDQLPHQHEETDRDRVPHNPQLVRRNTVGGGGRDCDGFYDHGFMASTLVSPRYHRRNSSDFVEIPHFLKACGLCQKSLRPGKDIYMYRGETAFCSLECRQQQMNHDERKDKNKCSVLSKIETTSKAGSESSTKGETVAAA